MAAIESSNFREKLLRAFPPRKFCGLVTTHDECDDGIHLTRELTGKQWDELSDEVLFHGSIALPLMEPEALVAFLPAWILRGQRELSKDNVALELTLYFLCPGNEEDGWNETRIRERSGLFNPEQRKVIGEFLELVRAEVELEWHHSGAEFGLRWWRG